MQQAARGGFFSYHGLWAPGVRLFRKLGFRAKALLITSAFVIPLALVLWAYLSSTQQTIDVARQERAGAALIMAIEPWLAEAQKQRSLVGTGLQPQADIAALDAAMAPVQRAVQAKPGGIDAIEAWRAVSTAHDALKAAPAGQQDKALHTVVDAVRALRGSVLDRSQLTLDPDQDTYYLMSVATGPVADAIDAISLTPALAVAAQREGGSTVGRLRGIYGAWATGQQALGLIDEQVTRAAEANPGLKQYVQPADAVKAGLEFFAASDARWFGETLSADVAALRPLGQVAIEQLRSLGASSMVQLSAQLQARIDRTQQSRWFLLGACGVSLLLAGYLFHCFYTVMEGGLTEVGRHLTAMTRGDLTTSPRPWGHDEAARLMLLLADMQKSLRGMVLQVRGSSDGIVQTSSEIAEGAMDLSARTEQTAANLEESASAMEQISATVRQTADNAQEATHIAAHNAQVAARGGEVIANMVSTMEGIHTSSTKIGDIIGVIDGIAFQTNILALNAAVEAARAGEQGRGFAVVASEVRALAQRSASAAREIKALINVSVSQVAAGAAIVRDAGATIGEIVNTAERVNQLLADIAIGSREQSVGVGQVGEAVQDLDRSTQQNAALVEQTAAAAGTLKDQALALAGEVARFKLPSLS
jgi:methyl-accepting chemotaxis protein